MKKYGKQRLLEMMQRVNPDFTIKEENEIPEYTGDEIFLLYVLVYNLMNAHHLYNRETTEKFIYDYNQKHGNIIEFPLVAYNKDELTKQVADFLYGENVATDTQLMDIAQMTSDQIIPMLNKKYEAMKEYLRQVLMVNRPEANNDKTIDDILYRHQSLVNSLSYNLKQAEKYKNFPSSKNSLNTNFYEMFPVASPTWDGSLSGERAVNAMKSLVNKKAVVVIPFTEEEKVEMDNKLKGTRDYLTPTWGYTKEGYAHVILLEKDRNKIIQQYNDYTKNNFKFTKEYLNDLLSTSMEGGSNYWALFDHRFIAPQLANDKSLALSEKIINSVWDYHKSIPIYDVESNEGEETDKEYGEYDNPYENYEKLGELSMDSILQAVSLIKKDPKLQHIWENIATENYDAGDADVFFQLAIMGKVVFG